MKSKASRGITLLETVVASSILTMGVSAIVGTSLYTFATYNRTLLRLTALGLAREGIEVTRNIRDSNWLPPNAIDYCGEADQVGYIAQGQYCYKGWLAGLDNCAFGCKAVFKPEQNIWSLDPSANDYALYKNSQADGHALYTDQNNGSPPPIFLKIRIFKNNTGSPYTADHPELKVVSTVAWLGRSCVNDFSGDPESARDYCKIVVEERLTNWKDY